MGGVMGLKGFGSSGMINTNKVNYFKLKTFPWTCPKCNTTVRVKLYHKIWKCAFCGNKEEADEKIRKKEIESFKKNGTEHRYKTRFNKLR
jgi:ribosomal protein L37AE/L43A